jgi:sigma-B regulation protein RsbU (phosphoserine phosphatase)
MSTPEIAATESQPRSGLRALAATLVEGDGKYARRFDNFILFLIALSLLSVGLEAISGLPAWARTALWIEELIVVAAFAFEYFLRIVAADNKLAFIFSFYGIVDLLAIAPFFLSGMDTRFLRVLRVLRILRVLKLQRRVLEAAVNDRTRELAERNAELERAQAQLREELSVARALQSSILPAAFPARAECDGTARMTPATTMGGDFYDFIELPDARIGIVMADVSGKGVPAAFFMAVSRTSLREQASHHSTPGACLAQTNDVLCGQNPLDLFVTVFYAILDPATGVLCYANGGHNPPLIARADGAIESLDGEGGLVLGVMPGVSYPEHTMQLRPDDRLVLYTDGITEAFNPANEAYGLERLVAEILAHRAGSSHTLVERICGSVTHFAGTAPQSDDITLTALKWNPR